MKFLKYEKKIIEHNMKYEKYVFYINLIKITKSPFDENSDHWKILKITNNYCLSVWKHFDFSLIIFTNITVFTY